MPRIRNTVIAATVLAVGASLAFREGAFYQRAAGVEPRATKATHRNAREETSDRSVRTIDLSRPLTDGEFAIPLSREKAEHMLERHGRNVATLYVVMILSEDPAYREELRGLRDRADAMALLSIDDLECARRARELDPQNARTILAEARLLHASGAGEKEVISAFLQLASAKVYQHPWQSIGTMTRNMLLESGAPFEVAWEYGQKINDCAELPDRNAASEHRLFLTLLERMAAQMIHEPDAETTAAIRQTIEHLASLPGFGVDLSLAEAVDSLTKSAHLEQSPQLQSRINAAQQERSEDGLFRLGLMLAAEDVLAETERVYRQDGIEKARQTLFACDRREDLDKAAQQMQKAILGESPSSGK